MQIRNLQENLPGNELPMRSPQQLKQLQRLAIGCTDGQSNWQGVNRARKPVLAKRIKLGDLVAGLRHFPRLSLKLAVLPKV
jgi:hypothetical protein